MPDQPGTVEIIARELGRALAPLADRLQEEQVRELLGELGLRVPEATPLPPAVVTSLAGAAAAAAQLPARVATLDGAIRAGGAAIVAAATAVIDQVRALITGVQGIQAAFTGAGGIGPLPPAVVAAFAADLAPRLIEHSLVRHLEGSRSGTLALLRAVGLVDGRRLRLDRISGLLTDPAARLEALYGWGAPGFDGQRLLIALSNLFAGLRMTARLEPIAPGSPQRRLRLLPLTITPLTTPSPRLRIELSLDLGTDLQLEQPLTERWRLYFAARGRLAPGFRIDLRPPSTVELVPPGGAAFDGRIAAGVRATPPAGRERLLVLGEARGTRLEAGSIQAGATLGLRAGASGGEGELGVEAGIQRGRLAIALGGADSFLGTILPPDGITVDLEVGIGWSGSRGVYLTGSAGLETTLAVRKELGPLRVESVHFQLGGAAAGGLRLAMTASGSGRLGPVTATVERIGAALILTPRGDHRGNAGPFDLGFAFEPPTGLGIAIDAGPVTGGGFLSFHRAEGRYDGVLQLQILAVQVTAIGLLDTRVEGAPFAFLIVISAELPDIQLGFGFTLKGLGGALGVHRTVDTGVLQAGLRAHTLDSILFPRDAIARATQIISDLRRVFPPAAGRYVLGPVAKLGWGTPTLIEAKLGLILEVPDPIRLALLGQISAALPTKQAAIVELHVDVLGVLDFGRKTLAIDASLYDSRIAMFSIYGDMALRLSWGDPPAFAFSLGGLHPAFAPPPDFPALRRLTVALGVGGNPRITMQSYMALTSNTVQFGARAELYAEAAGFNIYGWIGFDVLVIFSPFSFRADFSAGVALRRGTSTIAGIRVNATLTGPTPFHAWGEACISILFLDVCVGFDAAFGERRREELPARSVWEPLAAAIRDPRSWSARLPSRRVVTLAEPAPGAPPLVDPFGVLELHQKVAPLNRPIDKFGEAAPSDVRELRVTGVALGAGAERRGVPFSTTQDYFAPAQFRQMSDDAKLSARSFEPMDAGIALTSQDVAHGPAIGTDLVYETKIIDAPDRPARVMARFSPLRSAVLSMIETGALARSAYLSAGERRFEPPPRPPIAGLHEERFVVVSARDLGIRADVLAGAAAHGEALAALDRHLAAHPRDRGRLELVPLHEVEAA